MELAGPTLSRSNRIFLSLFLVCKNRCRRRCIRPWTDDLSRCKLQYMSRFSRREDAAATGVPICSPLLQGQRSQLPLSLSLLCLFSIVSWGTLFSCLPFQAQTLKLGSSTNSNWPSMDFLPRKGTPALPIFLSGQCQVIPTSPLASVPVLRPKLCIQQQAYCPFQRDFSWIPLGQRPLILPWMSQQGWYLLL